MPKSKALNRVRTEIVDMAGLGTRIFTLPREIFRCRVHWKKSAEVIVTVETSRDCEYHTPLVSQSSEGPNIELCPNSAGNTPTGV